MNIVNYKSGKLIPGDGYKYFLPESINHDWELSPILVKLANDAIQQLGELNAYSILVPNIDLYISMHVAKEAETSSRIEGTQTNIEDVFSEVLDIDPEKRDDWEEVQNYIASMKLAIDTLQTIPLSSRLIKDIHKVLLQGVRGQHKEPGEFRRSQNWIGGTNLTDAHFVPPQFTLIGELMSDLEKFIHDKKLFVPDIVKIGIIHYQFETIHPFLDGNGRIGRLLIILYLIDKAILTKPVLYLSQYFEKYRSLYYDNLDRVRSQNDLEHWLKFFLIAITNTAKKSVSTLKKVLELHARTEQLIHEKLFKKAANAKLLINFLYTKPVTNAQQAGIAIGVNTLTAQRLIDDLVAVHILVEKTGFKRNREYIFGEYIQLFSD